jgi:hypothetical protein
MPLNPYFINGTSSEQRLIQDLVNEQLKMFGQDVVYMPRKFITEKKIIKELLVSKFDDSFHLEAYIATADGFGGQGDILSKFGVRSTDEITLIISKERFEDFISPFIQEQIDIKLTIRPQEGDLIYFPLDNALFEIKYVEGKRPFYQLNNLYVYELKCELFEYEDEVIDTGLGHIDETIKDFGYIMTLNMVNSSAVPSDVSIELSINQNNNIQNGKSISYIDIINGGYGYKSTPEVVIEKAPTGGVTATAVAILTTRNNQSTISDILVVNPGIGYTEPPEITIISSTGSGFIATSIINGGVLGPISILDAGVGYSTPPIVSISTSPTGKNAEAISVLSSSGSVAQIRYINAGAGYTVNPSITVSSPLGISTGNYVYNEVVSGSVSGTNAYVKDWNYDTRILKVGIIDGNFALGESVVGSAATYKVFSIETDNIYDTYASNEEIQEVSNQVLDFSESNPFGEF